MKKLIFLLFITAILASCDCVVSQIPPQYLYAGENCTAPIPDYKNHVVVTGGCFGFTVTQIPAPGTLLSVTNKDEIVTIKATGFNGKSSTVMFMVTLLDTITPKITINTVALEQATIKQANALYDAGDRIIKKLTTAPFPWDSLGIIEPIDVEDKMLIAISMDSAGTGIRKRIFTFTDVLQIGEDTAQVGKLSWKQLTDIPVEFLPAPHNHAKEQLDLSGVLAAVSAMSVFPDSIHWSKVYGLENLNRVPYMVDYRQFMDWQAYAEYMPIPTRVPSVAPDLSLVSSAYQFAPLVYDNVAKKMKFWNGTVWKTITSN